jgi:uncharacterized protein YdeI (YjbR/CyaY-like superfamily)
VPAARPRLADLDRVEVTSREGWRAWLAENHARSGGVWVVTHKKRPGAPHVPYGDIVDEALCFGWIDGLARALDAERSMRLATPRRTGSAWSKINKEKVDRLTAAGLMAPPGLARVAAAMADGSWTSLDAVETLVPPADLAAALAADPRADACFAAFPRSSRRAILEWIAAARRPETRATRIAETVARAAENRKANFPAGRDRGPAPRGDPAAG